MKLTGILLVGFLGFIDQLLTQISTRFTWFEQETNKTKNVQQAISILYGEVLSLAILFFSPVKIQILEMFGADVGIYVDAVLSGILYSFGGNLAHTIMDWVNANKELKQAQAEAAKTTAGMLKK
jgi:tetrahydromethanopterin S-methyltransferase subunit G